MDDLVVKTCVDVVVPGGAIIPALVAVVIVALGVGLLRYWAAVDAPEVSK